MRLLIYIAIVGCLVLGCTSQKETTETRLLTSTKTDRTYTTKKLVDVDTLITVPKDSISLSVPLKNLTEKPIEKSNGRTTARVSYRNNNIEVDCLTEEYQQIITLQKEVIETQRLVIQELKDTINKNTVITKVPWYFHTTTYVIGIFILGILYVAFKILKR